MFTDSFTMINPVGTSRERIVCGSHASLGGHALSMGVGVAGPESALAVATIWVSQTLEERVAVL